MNRKINFKKDGFVSILIIVFMAVPGLFSSPAGAFERDVLNISNTGEKWTDEWHVVNTVIAFPGGGKSGFYRRLVKNGEANPSTGRDGILCLYPENRYNPARIIRKNIEVSGANPHLKLGVCANRIPRGDWGLSVKVNDKLLFEEITIAGDQGWQDLSFELSVYVDQRVDIIIEASSTAHRNEYVFIDYIEIDDEGGKPTNSAMNDAAEKALDQSLSIDTKNDSFDSEYKNFLELLNSRDGKSSQKGRQQTHQKQP